MIKGVQNVIFFAAFLFSISANAAPQANTDFDLRTIAKTLQEVASKDQLFLNEVAQGLGSKRVTMSVNELVNRAQKRGVASQNIASLRAISTNYCLQSGRKMMVSSACQAGLAKGMFVPEVWMFKPKNKALNMENLVFAFPPADGDDVLGYVEGYDMHGNVTLLSTAEEPNVPVLMVEKSGAIALEYRVAEMNKALQAAGVQKATRTSLTTPKEVIEFTLAPAALDIDTFRLDKVRVDDVKEGWFGGSAEIFAMVSGVRAEGSETREPSVAMITLPYLDDDGKTYYPNQLVLFWDDYYPYNVANMVVMEQDGNFDTRGIISAILDGIGAIGNYYGQPIVSLVTEIANAIIAAMPSAWFRDDHDYVDTFYTLEKDQVYRDYMGVSGNAQISLTPYRITGQ